LIKLLLETNGQHTQAHFLKLVITSLVFIQNTFTKEISIQGNADKLFALAPALLVSRKFTVIFDYRNTL
jgi:hypothetical protein